MPRRRPGAGGLCLTAIATYFLLTPIVWASLQQEHQNLYGDNPRGFDLRAHPASFKEQGPQMGLDINDEQYKYFRNTDSKSRISPDTLSAVQTFAPARQHDGGVAVRASSPAPAGLAATHPHARSLQDWEIEDVLLLATVDGYIYARDRKTGAHRWGPVAADTPMVEMIYHRENVTATNYLDHLVWIVEPSARGEIYLYNKAVGSLEKVGTTIKDLHNIAPWSSESPGVVYTSDKSTTLYNLDAATGDWLRVFGSRGSAMNDRTTCRVNEFGSLEEQECGLMGTLTLGRVTYTVRIEHRDTAEPVCTIKYSEWVPNNRDQDLQAQYQNSMDRSYVYSSHDGRILALKHAVDDLPGALWTQKMSSPVVRVFDVARPASSDSRDAELVVLPQPLGPMTNEVFHRRGLDENRVFINHTKGGGWYALSEQTYPTVTRGVNQAQCYDPNWLARTTQEQKLTPTELETALVGVHPLKGNPNQVPQLPHPLLTIGAPSAAIEEEASNIVSTNVPLPPSSSIISDSFFITHAPKNPIDVFVFLVMFILTAFFMANRRHVSKLLHQKFDLKHHFPNLEVVRSEPPSPVATDFPKLEQETEEKPLTVLESVVTKQLEPQAEPQEPDQRDASDPESEQLTPTISRRSTLEVPEKGRSRASSLADRRKNKDAPRVRIMEPSSSPGPDDDGEVSPETAAEKEKKKARRGTRGGKAHRRKKNKQNKGEGEADGDIEGSMELTIAKTLEINHQPTVLEPDVIVVDTPTSSDPTSVGAKILQIGHLTVYEDTILGFGSHGTRVFKGIFGGRDVAVKCMLKEFYDVASHEVTLLQESDDHPNVIRYYDKESAGGFLYIALELCPASLSDVVDRPSEYQELLGPTGLDLVDALRQITMGIRYLHSLKIVHRDIKPENILVAAPKKLPTRPNLIQPARLLISDFGLCKKLEVDQSSFRATTAHAAGTSGWRAPELLIDDEHEDARRTDPSLGTQHSTNSEPVVLDTATNRRATRAIDIFALGCVFYYVLSNGNHPFDGKGRGEGKYMREANIIRGNYMLDDLSVLGAYQGEAHNLIGSMLTMEPKARPDAAQVLAHPFFWSPVDRLDFLCHVSDQFEFEPRDPPSYELQTLESIASEVLRECKGDFLRALPIDFVATLGKQRKYQGGRLLDLLRAMRNKKNHYEDMPDSVKAKVGSLPEGYLLFWTTRFPLLLMGCHQVVKDCGWEKKDRFRKYYDVS